MTKMMSTMCLHTLFIYDSVILDNTIRFFLMQPSDAAWHYEPIFFCQPTKVAS